jgi:hypothetical protein
LRAFRAGRARRESFPVWQARQPHDNRTSQSNEESVRKDLHKPEGLSVLPSHDFAVTGSMTNPWRKPVQGVMESSTAAKSTLQAGAGGLEITGAEKPLPPCVSMGVA